MILVLLLLAGFSLAPIIGIIFNSTIEEEVKSDDERKVKVTYDYFK